MFNNILFTIVKNSTRILLKKAIRIIGDNAITLMLIIDLTGHVMQQTKEKKKKNGSYTY